MNHLESEAAEGMAVTLSIAAHYRLEGLSYRHAIERAESVVSLMQKSARGVATTALFWELLDAEFDHDAEIPRP